MRFLCSIIVFVSILSAIFFAGCGNKELSEITREYEKQLEKEHDIVIRVLVRDHLYEKGYEKEIMQWVMHARRYFSKHTEIRIRFLPLQEFRLEGAGGKWHHHKQRAIIQEFANQYKKPEESLLVFVSNGAKDSGKTQSDAGVSMVALNPDHREGTYLNRKWLTVHEISHLFGTEDVIDPNNIMDEDFMLNVTPETDSLLSFDEHAIAIMKIARSYMIEKKISAFSQILCDYETGEKLIAYRKAYKEKLRNPEEWGTSVGAFYLNHGQYEKSLAYLNEAVETINENRNEGFQEVAYDLVLYNKGLSLYQLKRYEEAVEAFRESLEKGPPIPYNKHYWLGAAFTKWHDLNNDWTDESIDYGIETFKQSAEHHPDYSWGWCSLASLELYRIPIEEWESDDVEQVISHLRQCTELQPDCPQGMLLLGAVLQHQGKPDEAGAFIQKATGFGIDSRMFFQKKGGIFRAKSD